MHDIERFDDEADVVVVGLGCAGASAAIAASERGLDVLAVERQGAPGGTSAMSGGLIYPGGGTPVQRACGFEDDADTMYDFLVAATAAHGGADPTDRPDLAKLRFYCDESVAHFVADFLRKGATCPLDPRAATRRYEVLARRATPLRNPS